MLLCSMTKYPVPLELQGEEKVFGGYISARQFGYIVLALLLTPVTMKLSSFLVGPLRVIPALRLAPAVVGGILSLAIWAVLMALAFMPAGWLGLAPGPKESYDSDPWAPALRLDQWLLVVMRHKRKPHVLPYKRGAMR